MALMQHAVERARRCEDGVPTSSLAVARQLCEGRASQANHTTCHSSSHALMLLVFAHACRWLRMVRQRHAPAQALHAAAWRQAHHPVCVLQGDWVVGRAPGEGQTCGLHTGEVVMCSKLISLGWALCVAEPPTGNSIAAGKAAERTHDPRVPSYPHHCLQVYPGCSPEASECQTQKPKAG